MSQQQAAEPSERPISGQILSWVKMATVGLLALLLGGLLLMPPDVSAAKKKGGHSKKAGKKKANKGKKKSAKKGKKKGNKQAKKGKKGNKQAGKGKKGKGKNTRPKNTQVKKGKKAPKHNAHKKGKHAANTRPAAKKHPPRKHVARGTKKGNNTRPKNINVKKSNTTVNKRAHRVKKVGGLTVNNRRTIDVVNRKVVRVRAPDPAMRGPSPNGFSYGQSTWWVDRYATSSGWSIQFSNQVVRQPWQWYGQVRNALLGPRARPNAIMVLNQWPGNPLGHVAFVRAVKGDRWVVSHVNWLGDPLPQKAEFEFVPNRPGFVRVVGQSEVYPLRGFLYQKRLQ